MIMDTIFKITFIVINFIFLGLYTFNFIISLIRDIKSKNKFKTNNYFAESNNLILPKTKDIFVYEYDVDVKTIEN